MYVPQIKQPCAGVKRPRAGVDVQKLNAILDIRGSTTGIMMVSILENCGPIAGSSLGPVQTSGGDGSLCTTDRGGDGSLCTMDRGNISHQADLAYMILGPA
jgi:hypothetical protein